MKKPLVLVIMDGFGINPSDYGNAIAAAKKPHLDRYFKECPNTTIGASGLAVGLPEGQMGNSEVGHTNIGAGRVVYQELTRITKNIEDGHFFYNDAFEIALQNCKRHRSRLHLIVLLSDGGVHSHNAHLYGLIELAKRASLEKHLFIHAFLDGRDVPPSSALHYVDELEAHLKKEGIGKIATLSGRYYAMDRDNRWERVSKAYDAMVNGEGPTAATAHEAVEASYKAGKTDEFVEPVVIDSDGAIRENDSVIFFNFRPDRAREITRAIVDPEFNGFERKKGFFPTCFVTMTQYDATMPNVSVAFKPETLTNTFGEYISQHGMTQLRIAETEKYAHVTFFFNGGVEKVCEGEDRVLVQSPKVATYDLQPEMSEPEVTEKVVANIKSGKYDAIILNFANCDMVGHTGVLEAAVKAVEAVDDGVGQVVDAATGMGGTVLITADHGNADQMIAEDGTPFTAHTTRPVPFIVVGRDCKLREGGKLADIAPTMLKILSLPVPKEMTGESLIAE